MKYVLALCVLVGHMALLEWIRNSLIASSLDRSAIVGLASLSSALILLFVLSLYYKLFGG